VPFAEIEVGMRRAAPSQDVPQDDAPVGRMVYVDVLRGLLIAHMALDHASLLYNAGRGGEELARLRPPDALDSFQFLTRFTGVPVAPGFCFMAGFMVAVTSALRSARGVSERDVTRRLVTRGLVLVAVDATLGGLPRYLNGFFSFMVLSCIGVSLLILALVRRVPSRVLLPIALGVVALHPFVDVSWLPVPLRAVLYEPIRTGPFRSLYPLIPWTAIVVLGFIVGRDAIRRERPARLWLGLSAASLALFFAVRVPGGYGNAYPTGRLTSEAFWTFAKYPPDLPFLTFASFAVFLALFVLERLTKQGVPPVLRAFVIYGRVPFFFYVVHFYVLGIGRAIIGRSLGLPGTYAVWLVVLAVMAWPCAWYYRKKRDRPNLVTRYF
jgi:uncharacterized membrane protein